MYSKLYMEKLHLALLVVIFAFVLVFMYKSENKKEREDFKPCFPSCPLWLGGCNYKTGKCNLR